LSFSAETSSISALETHLTELEKEANVVCKCKELAKAESKDNYW
jgi:hypothetical protein